MTGMLASVENLAEARCVLATGADIIDLKAPALGALGALPTERVAEIVAALGGQKPISATIGDLPLEPLSVAAAVDAMAATGVDFVKIGLFPGGQWKETVAALEPAAWRGLKLVAVLFGDHRPDLGQVEILAEAGFAGVMLDTQDKARGPLPQVCELEYLRDFVAEAKAHRLLSGLAGSLRLTDIPFLLNLRPDYLGFRGALCERMMRTSALDADAVRAVRARIPVCRPFA